MSAPALICDTGALLEFLVAGSPEHQAYRDAIVGARTRYVPELVLAELDYFLREERPTMRAFMEDLYRGAFTYAPATPALLRRAMEVDGHYAALELGLVDGLIVALAEQLGVVRLATRDLRHFEAVELRRGRRFDIVVRPRSSARGGR